MAQSLGSLPTAVALHAQAPPWILSPSCSGATLGVGGAAGTGNHAGSGGTTVAPLPA